MIPITRYPAQMNGYTIAAVCARVQQRTNNFNEDEAVILGLDLSRRFGKFVTAYMALKTEDGEPPTEWVLGNYYEDLNHAMDNFLHRAGLRLQFPTQVDWNRIQQQQQQAPDTRTAKERLEDHWRRLGEGV